MRPKQLFSALARAREATGSFARGRGAHERPKPSSAPQAMADDCPRPPECERRLLTFVSNCSLTNYAPVPANGSAITCLDRGPRTSPLRTVLPPGAGYTL